MSSSYQNIHAHQRRSGLKSFKNKRERRERRQWNSWGISCFARLIIICASSSSSSSYILPSLSHALLAVVVWLTNTRDTSKMKKREREFRSVKRVRSSDSNRCAIIIWHGLIMNCGRNTRFSRSWAIESLTGPRYVSAEKSLRILLIEH
jgi:hypothetical protein